ncbi:MAG: FadR family transcriptional regulator [Treponema sp.]|nr:FadR family transcriptional regulator [Treponema sp.]
MDEIIRAQNISFHVLERIKAIILNENRRPGDKIPTESELSQRLGVGKSSIREAVKMLEVLGVLETRHGDGTYIKSEPCADLINPLAYQLLVLERTPREIIELRATFEPAFTLAAMESATSEDIEKIEGSITNLVKSIKLGMQTAEEDLEFHYAILASTHNPFIILIGRTILQLFSASIDRSMRSIPEVAVKDHKRIFKAFCAKDKEKLLSAIEESYKGWILNL